MHRSLPPKTREHLVELAWFLTVLLAALILTHMGVTTRR